MYTKLKVLLICFVMLQNGKLPAQNFSIYCDTLNLGFESPFILECNGLFDDGCNGTTIDMKKVNASFSFTFEIEHPIFIALLRTQLIAIPGQSISGLLKNSGEIFVLKDTNNANQILMDFENRALGITAQYNATTTFDNFVKLYDSLHNYINSLINYILSPGSKENYKISNETFAALRALFIAKLAHFTVLPILYKGTYSDKLFAIIKRDIKINSAKFWLQTPPGRIFLRTYFVNVVLPQNEYDLENALASSILFNDSEIKKYLQYWYYKSITNSVIPQNDHQATISSFKAYLNKYKFSESENEDLRELNKQLELPNTSIIPLFAQQRLITGKNKILSTEQKKNLLQGKGNVIVEYWASWCIPCIALISKLKSDSIIYKGQKYRLLFISKDTKQNDWLKKTYPVLNSINSFRLTNFTSPSFYKTFNILSIPRLFLIKNGLLINQDYPKENLEEMLKN